MNLASPLSRVFLQTQFGDKGNITPWNVVSNGNIFQAPIILLVDVFQDFLVFFVAKVGAAAQRTSLAEGTQLVLPEGTERTPRREGITVLFLYIGNLEGAGVKHMINLFKVAAQALRPANHTGAFNFVIHFTVNRFELFSKLFCPP